MARAHAGTPQMGRTHGQHAVPMTFGFAMALYVSRLGQRIESIVAAAEEPARQIRRRGRRLQRPVASTGPASPATIEAMLMHKLGLTPPEISTQVTQPEYVADYRLRPDVVLGRVGQSRRRFPPSAAQRNPRTARPQGGRSQHADRRLLDDAAQGQPQGFRERQKPVEGVYAAAHDGADGSDLRASARPDQLGVDAVS